MELRNLRADITSLEAASGLTVDDILGIMQDLWGDVRHESGRAAEDNPVRDADELTSKLIWACNQLVKITERHADALSGVSRLSRLQEKLTALQTQADAYEAAGSKMEQLQAEETRLETAVAGLRARQDELERRVREKTAEEKTLTQNITKLTGLQQQLTQKQTALVRQQTTLTTANNQLTTNVGNLKNAVQQLVRQQADLTQKQADLTQKQTTLTTANTRLTTEVGNLENAVQTLTQNITKLTGLQQQLEDEHKAAQEEADRLSGYDEQLEELSRKLTQLREIVRKLREDTKYLEIRGDEKPFALEPSLTAGVKQSEKIIAALRKAVQDYRTDSCN